MRTALKVLIASVTTASAVALAVVVIWFPPIERLGAGGLSFWILATLASSASPISLPRGTKVNVSGSAILAAGVLGGPGAAGIVAALGTTEARELRGEVPWYGSLYNHASLVLPAILELQPTKQSRAIRSRPRR